MSEPIQEIQMIPVDAIKVLNPRSRNRRVFDELVQSIATLGLKKPITVTRRNGNGARPTYNMVCGQGRLEAFVALNQREIPAIVIDATTHDCYVMSLVENLARRTPKPIELVREIGSLKERGYTTAEIARKVGFSEDYVAHILGLFARGEERLLAAVERGIIPTTIALEIANAKDADVQQALAEAFEQGLLPRRKLLAVRRIVEQRNRVGRLLKSEKRQTVRGRTVTSNSLVAAYKREVARQKLIVRKAELTNTRLLFLVKALQTLMQESAFAALLRAEGMPTMPRVLAELVQPALTQS